LGLFGSIVIFEAPTEMDALNIPFETGKLVIATSETLIDVPREEAVELP